MKIKTVKKSYGEVMAMPRAKHKKPSRPWFVLRLLIRILAIWDLFKTRFTYSFPDRSSMVKRAE